MLTVSNNDTKDFRPGSPAVEKATMGKRQISTTASVQNYFEALKENS